VKANKMILHLPNFITILNMLLGLAVLYQTFGQNGEAYRLPACILILIAAALDALDGSLARALNTESALGKQLDSFADLISFGLAPVSILLTHSSFRDLGWIMFACAAFYIVAAAFRLARFNTGNFTGFFLGLPITAAGFVLILVNLILHFNSAARRPFSTIPVIVLIYLLALLMVSKVKIYRRPHVFYKREYSNEP
jgi:CDP-diacylglycerol--serine O-phosphatidyltransferase